MRYQQTIIKVMEPEGGSMVKSIQGARAKHLQKLFDEKVLDLFLQECEVLKIEGVNLSQFSKQFQLGNDMEEQYHSMKRVFAETDRVIEISRAKEEGWNKLQVDQHCTMSVRVNGSIMEMKSSGVIDLNLKHLLIVAFLIKHYKQCVPFCKEAADLKQPTKLEKIGFLRLSIPIPFLKDRSCILRGIGFQRKDTPHRIYIYAEGVTENSEYTERHEIDAKKIMKNRQLLDIKYFAAQITCLGRNKFQYTGYAFLDHHIPMLPQRLVTFVAKEIGKHVFKKVFKEMAKFDKTVWGKELKDNYQENAYFYDWVDEAMEKWIKEIEDEENIENQPKNLKEISNVDIKMTHSKLIEQKPSPKKEEQSESKEEDILGSQEKEKARLQEDSKAKL